MATVQHSTLTAGDLHEPKGIAAADPNSVYIANGSGSGDWVATPFASAWYRSGTGTTFTTPSTFTLINVLAAPGILSQFTINASGRLTYTGTRTSTFQMNMMLSGRTSSGTEVDAAIFLNGTLAPEFVVASTETQGASSFFSVSIPVQFQLSTNDYIEVYAQCSTGNLIIENFSLTAQGLI